MRGHGFAACVLVGVSVLLAAGSQSSASSRAPTRHLGLPEALLNHDVVVMNADGSNQRNLTRSVADELDPVWAPDGSKIAYSRPDPKTGLPDVFVMNADGGHKRNLTRHPRFDCCPVWSPDGRHIAFYSSRGAVGAESDIFVMTAEGTALKNLTRTVTVGESWPAWSPDGTRIAFVSGPPGADADIYVMNADGSSPRNMTRNPASDGPPIWSPDGAKIAFESRGRGTASPDIMVMNADGTDQMDLTPDPQPETRPAWSPDGSKIAFQGYGTYGNNDIYIMSPDGSANENLTPGTLYIGDGSPAWSPDSSTIAYGTHLSVRPTRGPNREIWTMNRDGTGKRDISDNPVFDDFPSWSPDGGKILFTRRSPICRVPYVIGRRLAYARMQIELWKCRLGRVRYHRSHRRRGLVLRMSPRPGGLFLYRTPVRLLVSGGR